MSKQRTAKYGLAVLASIIAGIPLATISQGQARGTDECLLAPKGAKPEGTHWNYRIDRATKRHCWYLRQVGDKVSPQSSRSAKAIPPQAASASQRLVVDAHAELPAQTNLQSGADRAVRTVQADGASAANIAALRVLEPARSVIATRWPEPSGVSAPVAPTPPQDKLASNVQSNSPPAPPSAQVSQVSVPLAAADSSLLDQFSSVPMLLGVIAGALALAAITARLVLSFGGPRLLRPAKVRVRRGASSEFTDDDRIVLSDIPMNDVLPRRRTSPRDLDQAADNPNRRTAAEFFSRVSIRTPTLRNPLLL
jgi:hypothetical protein